MNYYELSITGEYKVWRKYFTFNEEFYYRNKEIDFNKAFRENKIEKLKLKALTNKGEYVESYKSFKKDIAPPISEVDNVFIFREDISRTLNEIDDIKIFQIKIAGKFKNQYNLLAFEKIINCIDWNKSVRNEFDFLSKLILDKTKIPKNCNGFFLSEWNEYEGLTTIVSEKLKNRLLKIKDADQFLVFENV